MTQLGITPETTVVLYDDEGSLHAAWLFLVLDVLGHARVSVLDGGAQRWRAGGGAWRATLPPAPASSSLSTPRPSADRVAGAAWVRERLGRRDIALVDARSPEEFEGRDMRARRRGHIPGALNIEWSRHLRPDSPFRAPAELRQMYVAEGITPDKTVVLPDASPRRAHLLRPAPARLSARRRLPGLVGGVGQPPRPADRALSGVSDGPHRS